MVKFGLATFLKIIIFLHLSIIAWFINYLVNQSLFKYKVFEEAKNTKKIETALVKEIDYFFKVHSDFIDDLAKSSIFDDYNSKKFMPKLFKVGQAENRFNRFFVANTDGTFYTNDDIGNVAKEGLQTFNNSDPNSPVRKVSRRDYWEYTVGTNPNGEFRSFVSAPFISYVRGIRQIVFVTSIVRDGKTYGLIGGTVDWKLFSDFIDRLRKNHLLNENLWVSVIHESGAYWHHFDKRKKMDTIQDQGGNKIYDEYGEAIALADYVQYDKNADLAFIGKEIVKKKKGERSFIYDDFFLTSIYGPLHVTKNYSILVAKVISDQVHYYFFILMLFVNIFLTKYTYNFLRKFI